MPDLSPSETLRAAATRLRDLAVKATDGPWQACQREGNPGVDVVPTDRCGVYVVCPDAAAGMIDGDAQWIGAMSPAVAEPLAAELELHATAIELTEQRGDHAAVVVHRAAYMLAFARSILDGQS